MWEKFEGDRNKDGIIVEEGRMIDITDPKWGHPDGSDFWDLDPKLNEGTAMLYSPSVPQEEKLAAGKARQQAYMEQWWSSEHTCEV